MKINKIWIKFAPLVLVAILIGELVSRVATKNLINGVYPIEADSISIPILSTYLMFIFQIPFALALSFVSLSKYDEENKKYKVWFRFKIAFYLLSYLILSLFSLSGAMYWNTPYPNHNLISFSYMGLLALIQAIVLFDLYQIYLDYKNNKAST